MFIILGPCSLKNYNKKDVILQMCIIYLQAGVLCSYQMHNYEHICMKNYFCLFIHYSEGAYVMSDAFRLHYIPPSVTSAV